MHKYKKKFESTNMELTHSNFESMYLEKNANYPLAILVLNVLLYILNRKRDLRK